MEIKAQRDSPQIFSFQTYVAKKSKKIIFQDGINRRTFMAQHVERLLLKKNFVLHLVVIFQHN